MIPIEAHPLEPFLPANARLLLLGSFPPQQKRWSMDFYYPNLQNDMWRIFGWIFFENKFHFLLPSLKAFDKDRIVAFLQEKGIAVFDSATQVRRLQDNASDKYLEVIEATNIPLLLQQLPQCEAIVTTGQKSTDTLRSQLEVTEPAIGQRSPFSFKDKEMWLYRMPSSSRAYPKSIEEKSVFYKKMFEELSFL